MKQSEFLSYLNMDLDETSKALFTDSVCSNKIASREARLQIYADGYFYRLYSILCDDFAACEAIAGPLEFEKWTRKYLRDYPSTTESLVNVGENFPRFLSSLERPVLSEIASFEWELAKLEYSDKKARHGISPSNLINKQIF